MRDLIYLLAFIGLLYGLQWLAHRRAARPAAVREKSPYRRGGVSAVKIHCGGQNYFWRWRQGDYVPLLESLARHVADDEVCEGCARRSIGQIAAADCLGTAAECFLLQRFYCFLGISEAAKAEKS
jgi:hypothetical protein